MTVNVFISHKHEDQEAARAIKDKLEVFSAGRVEFFLSEDIPPGTNWFNWIEKHLARSTLLFLLFTNPSADWDWCLYETGMFTSIGGSKRRVICLHNPESNPPPQLKHLQACKARPREMKAFLKLFFGSNVLTGVRPINKGFANNNSELTRAAIEICKLLELVPTTAVERHSYTDYILLHVEDPSLIKGDRIPNDATIESTRANTMSMFGLIERPPRGQGKGGHWTWSDLKDSVLKVDKDWVEGLGKAIQASSRGQTIESIEGSFEAMDSKKIYRPVLHELNSEPDGSMGFMVVFFEQP